MTDQQVAEIINALSHINYTIGALGVSIVALLFIVLLIQLIKR